MAIQTIEDLTPDPRNARRHTPRNIGVIERSLNEVGAARSIVIDEDGVILAGNATTEAAQQAGITRVRVIEADGNELIAVQRRGLTPEQKVKLALADNRAAELAEWEPDVLAEIAAEMDVSGLFRADELAELAMLTEPEAGAGGDEFDTTPDDGGETRAQLGDLWVIGGKHRLLVGDCTDPANVARLMGGERAALLWADPPFGIAYTGHGASKDGRANKFEPIAGDDAPDPSWLLHCLPHPGAIYLKTTWQVLHAWEKAVSEISRLRAHIVWDRCSHSAGEVIGGYATQSEIILFSSIGEHKTNHFDTDVWSIPRATTGAPEQRTGHPYESPIALPQRAIENSSQSGGIVLDPFLGSGTTLIAAHRTGRRCYGMEISPKYADVILRRAEAEGLTVERVPQEAENTP